MGFFAAIPAIIGGGSKVIRTITGGTKGPTASVTSPCAGPHSVSEIAQALDLVGGDPSLEAVLRRGGRGVELLATHQGQAQVAVYWAHGAGNCQVDGFDVEVGAVVRELLKRASTLKLQRNDGGSGLPGFSTKRSGDPRAQKTPFPLIPVLIGAGIVGAVLLFPRLRR